MNAETLRELCLSFPYVTEDLPFGPETVVFRIAGKIFLLVSLDSEVFSFNVKCDPELAVTLREKYPNVVTPGYHMSKKHWNTIKPEISTPNTLLKEWINHSYQLVFNSLPKKTRDALLP